MLKLTCLALLLATAAAMPALDDFDAWASAHGKIYADANEYGMRKAVFTANVARVAAMQKQDPMAQYGLNEFADLSEQEFAAQRLGFVATEGPACTTTASPAVGDLPTSFDWREKGAVTPVKNQGQCGSCWAFSTTGDVEGTWFIAKNKLVSLSEQELVDCDHNGDQGCNGGLPSQAFEWLIKNGGEETESDYPYEGRDGSCSFDKGKAAVTISNWTCVDKDEDKIAQYLTTAGPISIGINAGWMQFYMGGVSDPLFCSPKHLDHGVLIVGFGEQSGKKYWIIKNSWGEGWGEKGYYRIIRGKGKCGLNTMATHSIV